MTEPVTEAPVASKEFVKYGIVWPTDDEIWIERQMIRHGGEVSIDGDVYGRGLSFHVRAMQSLLWPDKKWHKWNELITDEICKNRFVGIMGPASSGKTHEAACVLLTFYFCWPVGFTGMVSSTDSRSLELRVWGEIKKYWFKAKDMWPECPGHLIESKQMIITSDDSTIGRDFRNGLIGIPCVVGGQYVGLGKYVGVKNDHVMLCADELSFMGKAVIDSIANLKKNPDFRCCGMGNPKDPDDALGAICEPHPDIGGWEGVEQGEITRTWPTKIGGVCIQLVGTDSPNYDTPEDQPEPYPFLIGREDIKQDLLYYGQDSLQFQMMNLGIMPKGGQSRRVINTQMVETSGAKQKAIWYGSKTTLIAGLDAAYSSVGGDRTVLIFLRIGVSKDGIWIMSLDEKPIIVAVKARGTLTVEDQIAQNVKSMCLDRGVSPDKLFFDMTGRGSLVSAFARIWSANVNGIEFGGKPTDRQVSDVIKVQCSDHYMKFVSELWFFTRHVIEAGQMRQMSDDLIEEGSSREWGMTKGNKVDVEVKEITKKRMGRSPDIYDAFVCAAEGARRHGFVVQKLANMNEDDSKERDLFYLELMERKQGLHRGKRLNFAA